jgi:ATP-dependent Clp protease ATP-binding subunit ClpC
MDESTLPLTPRAKHTVARAGQIARERGHGYVGTEHLLLALIEDPDGIAGGTIARAGVSTALRDEVIRIIESDGYNERR